MVSENVGDLAGAQKRYIDMVRSQAPIDKIVRSLNAEFHMCFYVSNGKLWTSYQDDRGTPQKRVIAN